MAEPRSDRHGVASRRPARLVIVAAGAAVLLGSPARSVDPAAASSDRAARLATAASVQRRHAPDLMGRADVVGVGVAFEASGEAVIRILTARPGVASLPSRLDGVRVREVVSGRIYARRGPTCDTSGDGICQTLERWPLPVPIGVSIGHPAITAGTLGARVTDGLRVFALSNNHVLANINLAAPGDPALQPGTFDGGSLAAGDDIGALEDFEPIQFCGPGGCPQNAFDAAIAESTRPDLGFATPGGEYGSTPGYGVPNPAIHGAYGDPAVFGDEDLGQLSGVPVQKFGRTTQLTTGTIDTIGLMVDVCYDAFCGQVARFDDQLGIDGAFSAGGDSGSLVVTNDALRNPVALLFAGSETQTIASRIDLVLDRFGVTIEDGPLFSDAGVGDFAVPSFGIVGQTSPVSVTVRNLGNQPLPAFDVILGDAPEGTSQSLPAPPLDPGATAQLDFDWTPTQEGPHTLTASLDLVDGNPGNDQASEPVSVFVSAPGPELRLWSGTVRTDAWTTVTLDHDYGSDMVVVCTPQYDLSALGPMVARVRNASGTSFDVGVGRPWFGAFPGDHGAADVQCMVVRQGVYDAATDGVRMEAVRLEGFAAKDDMLGWVGQARPYAQTYAQPVVVGQVISPVGSMPGEIGVWSTFWSRGATALDPPSASDLFVGRHTGEDPGPRAAETLAYVVIETGWGQLGGFAVRAGVGSDSVRGIEDAPPYTYPLFGFSVVSAAVASQAGMDGGEGGWAILYGGSAVTPSALALAIEEDWYWDPERSHPTEQVAYLVFGRKRTGGRRCGLGVELALGLPALLLLRPRSRAQALASTRRRISSGRRIASKGLGITPIAPRAR